DTNLDPRRVDPFAEYIPVANHRQLAEFVFGQNMVAVLFGAWQRFAIQPNVLAVDMSGADSLRRKLFGKVSGAGHVWAEQDSLIPIRVQSVPMREHPAKHARTHDSLAVLCIG